MKTILWAALMLVSGMSSAWALEKCEFERHRPAYPPGEKIIKVRASKTAKAEKFNESKKFFDYLKQINGKNCDVDWTKAKSEIEDWLSTWQSAESTVGPELTALIAQQQKAPNVAPASSSASTTHIAVPASSPPEGPSTQVVAPTHMSALKERISALKAKTYNSESTRAAEIDSILRSMDDSAEQ